MRLRIRFDKLGKVRFTSHRDVARIWERAIRRAQIPVAYSEGFNPRPRVSFGLALSTGYESHAEYLDIEIDKSVSDLDPGLALERLGEALPGGMEATAIAEIDSSEPSLQHAVTSCTWRIDVDGIDAETAAGAVARALAAEEIIVTRERKGKPVVDDLRPLIHGFDVHGPIEQGVRLNAELGTQPRTVRPSELLAALDPPLHELRVCRMHQWITSDDRERREPLPLPVPAVASGGSR